MTDVLRCVARIWPRWAHTWVKCSAPLDRAGYCSAYGTLHSPKKKRNATREVS